MIGTAAAGGSMYSGAGTASDHGGGRISSRNTAAVIDLDGHHYGIGLHWLDLCVRLGTARVNISGIGLVAIIGILNCRISFI